MVKFTEFYPEQQGRPESKIAPDMETRQPSIPPRFISGAMLVSSYTETTIVNNFTIVGTTPTVLLVDASSGNFTVTLPEAATNAGKYFYIKKTDSSGNRVTIKGDGSSETIDGNIFIDLTIQYQFIMVHCNGSDWFILGGVYVKLEELLDKLLNVQIDLLSKILIEARQVKLHQASMSDENISEKDAED